MADEPAPSRRERVAVLVNGPRDGVAAMRASLLFTPADCDLIQIHRRRGRVRGFIAFVTRALKHRASTVYVMDVAAAGVVAALVLRLSLGARVVVDTGDATTALARSMGRVGPLGLRAVGVIEWLAHHVAAIIVVRGRYHRLYLRERGIRKPVIRIPDLPPPNLHEICGAGESHRDPSARPASLTVGLIGSLVWSPRLRRCYGWDVVEALSHLRDLPVRAVIIGEGDGLPWLQRRAAELRVADRITFARSLHNSELAEHLRGLDVCISTQSDDLVGWVRTTGKLPLYLAACRFVLASDVGDASWVLPDEMLIPYSGTIDPEYPGRLAERIRCLSESPERLALASIGRDLVQRHFNAHERSHQLLAALQIPTRAGP